MGVVYSGPCFSSSLLNWYDTNVRKFPWRSTNDPYHIWLSEIMLQQTRVKTVIPYYNNWLNDMPNIHAVSRSDLDYILIKWGGLGYYARARNFHSACRIVMNNFCGKIPDNYPDFQSLPGVGPYVASAVMSIAFNLPLPSIDVNAYRVVSRLKSIYAPFNLCKDEISKFLSSHMPSDRPGDFNQAIMDVGREICFSKNPSCDICPIKKYCSSFVNSDVDKYPFRAVSHKKPHYRIAVGVIWKNNKILISKRVENGFLGGLWEFPGGKIRAGEGPKNCIVREVNEELGICVRPLGFIKQIKHAYSHFSITLDAYHCVYVDGAPSAFGCAEWRWIGLEEIYQFPFPRANHRLFDALARE